MKFILYLIFGVSSAFYSHVSNAFISQTIQYVSQYQLGIDYSNSQDYVNLKYKTDAGSSVPATCTRDSADPTKKICSVGMVGGSSSGFGIFLQRAFKKQGFWYFDYDVGFGVRYLNGKTAKQDDALTGLPLKKASFELGAVLAKPYIQFGITPEKWPDILLSLGPAMQVAIGKVKINDRTESVVFGTSSYAGPMSLWRGFFEAEIVLKRFGDGAFSLFSSSDLTGQGEGTKVFNGDVDGMSDFRGAFSRNVGGGVFGFGLKLVTIWP
ncbi:MAG: hypothetical protein NT027_16605 [Proteobacteria bacterium]|nr:hypothetical protein [Pseudomonadota bacterium]